MSEDDLDTLMEGEDFVEGDLLDALVLDDEETERVELDADALAAIEAAEEFASTYNDELVVEPDMGGDENSSSDAMAARADGALDSILSAGSSTQAQLDAVLALAGADVADAEDVADAQGPQGFRKYDEDVTSGLSEDQRAEVAAYKLTKTELANLVPEVGPGMWMTCTCMPLATGFGNPHSESYPAVAQLYLLHGYNWRTAGLGHHQH